MIRGKRPIGAGGQDEVGNPRIIGADPVHEQEDDLVQAKPYQERQPGGHTGMADMCPLTP